MRTYISSSMVKVEHAKIIKEKLKDLKSEVPQDLDLEIEHCLANLLYLAAGDGSYKLTSDQINQIKGDEFSINWNE